MAIVVKGFKILHQLEQTGLRSLYRAVDIRTGQSVHLVHIQVRPGRVMERLKNRAELSQKIKLPSMISALHYGKVEGGGFYYTYPAFSSRPLQSVIDSIEDPKERGFAIAQYTIDLLEILDYLHQSKITHRDLSTSALRLTAKHTLVLHGFINARLRYEQKAIVNMVDLPYMAPELLTGKGAVTPKSDLYSVGVILFELLEGRVPYSSNYQKIEDMQQGRVAPEVSNELFAPMISRALSTRNIRYGSCREWIVDLEKILDQRPVMMKVRDFSLSVKNFLS